MRIGIHGGTFNPVHYGHLLLAESCREQLSLDQVWFVPNFVSPLKQDGQHADAKHRRQMLQLAISGYEPFRIDDRELNRGGVSYTVDTLAEIRQQNPDDELFLLIGADSLAEFQKWREPERICQLSTVVVVGRGGLVYPNAQTDIAFLSISLRERVWIDRVRMPIVEISSTDLRARFKENRSVRYQTPRGVEQYVRQHQLYVP